jgi:ABC-2 type transport system permease protein
MKSLAIMRKDLLHELRSYFALFMMVGAPLLIAGLLYFAFGGLSREGAPSLTVTRVAVANLDRGDAGSGVNLGADLLRHLGDAEMSRILAVSSAADVSAARAAVDSREADVAVMIPEDFSRAFFGSEAGPAGEVVVYHDPTLTLGPGLLRSVIQGFLDSAAGARISVQVAAWQASEAGRSFDAASARRIAERYLGEAGDPRGAVEIRQPSTGQKTSNEFAAMMKAIMVSMMVFFVFYTGANAAQSLVREREDGTLARLSSTPTSLATVLIGKTFAIGLTILVQVAVLLAVSAALFGIQWGDPLRMLVAFAGMLLAATGFGIMLVSFCTSSQQVGPVLGAGLTITGMLGGLFSNFVPGMPASLQAASLAMPQGWAARLWSLALAGASAGDMAFPALVLASMGVAFFYVGVAVQRRRLA